MSEDEGLGPVPERRVHPRTASVLRIARLVCGHDEQLCRIRNLSSGGAMVVTGCAHEVGARVELELKSGWKMCARVVWADGPFMGLEFDELVDPNAVLAADAVSGLASRAPRIRVEAQARLRFGNQVGIALVIDISLGGLKLALDEPGLVGREAEIEIVGLPALAGLVRWQEDERAGIAFHEPLDLETLSTWLARQRRAASGKAG